MANAQKIDRLGALRKCLDEQAARYEQLRGAADFRSYLAAKADRADGRRPCSVVRTPYAPYPLTPAPHHAAKLFPDMLSTPHRSLTWPR